MGNIKTSNYGGISLLGVDNWGEFIAGLNSTNYLFTPQTIFPDSAGSKFHSLSSYELFNSFNDQIEECAETQWESKFQRVKVDSE